ncbi:MAG: penicillin-binding protein 2 [Ignavibacteriae bacterium]|nr:penicillin-binding protein 2 [Ignavibacteriota bacterium]NOG97427.1 penicillin-binding protein 2 [Ignavibacteriota bacterium]
MNEEHQIGKDVRRRILLVIIIGFFSLVSFQLIQMQILEHAAFDEKSNENSIKKVVIDAPRGIFFDRNQKPIVSNKPSFSLQITPNEYDTEKTEILETALQLDSGYISKILYEKRYYSKYQPRKILKSVDFKSIAWLEENSEQLPGVSYKVDLQRDYAFGLLGSHMFGYIREISAEKFEKDREDYSLGDIIGYAGIEKSYERYLRGKKGYNYVIVDSRQKPIGKYLKGVEDIDPQKGYDLILTIDADAQKVAEEALKGKRGAVVAVEPSTGEILAFVSAPEYSLANFAAVTSGEYWKKLSSDPEKPLFNRASMSIKPPGSTIKMLAAIIGLEEKLISTYTTVKCTGGFRYGNRTFRCTHVHGTVDLEESIEKSCNIFYYQLILKIGLNRWAKYIRQFGFGTKTGIDIGEESKGIVPDSAYYNRVYGKNKWTEGNLLSLSIGQGELSATPVQLAQYVSLIANNGKTKKPHFVKGIVKNGVAEYSQFIAEDVKADISQRSFDIVKKGMYKVVNGEGSARHIRLPGIDIAGKTGTSQNPHGEDHALFVAFAPYENPKIAVAVIVENIGFGSTHAAPIAGDVIKAYLVKDENEFDVPLLTLKNQ